MAPSLSHVEGDQLIRAAWRGLGRLERHDRGIVLTAGPEQVGAGGQDKAACAVCHLLARHQAQGAGPVAQRVLRSDTESPAHSGAKRCKEAGLDLPS